MLEPSNNNELPTIPAKRYFTIGEVSELCGVKPHVLRYWEQEFPDVVMIRQIRSLLYEQGYTIGGARSHLASDDAKEDATQTKQLIHQMISELEDIVELLK